MRKLLTLSFLLISIASFGQSKSALRTIPEATFFGIDYSLVGIIGADESSSQFINVFEDINQLMQREYSKYVKPLEKKTDVSILGVDLRPVSAVNRAISSKDIQRDGVVPPLEEPALKAALGQLDFKGAEGYGVILIAEELNKATNRGIYELVFFNVETKEIITHHKISGKSKGFGLRNYWANSANTAIRSVKLSK